MNSVIITLLCVIIDMGAIELALVDKRSKVIAIIMILMSLLLTAAAGVFKCWIIAAGSVLAVIMFAIGLTSILKGGK